MSYLWQFFERWHLLAQRTVQNDFAPDKWEQHSLLSAENRWRGYCIATRVIVDICEIWLNKGNIILGVGITVGTLQFKPVAPLWVADVTPLSSWKLMGQCIAARVIIDISEIWLNLGNTILVKPIVISEHRVSDCQVFLGGGNSTPWIGGNCPSKEDNICRHVKRNLMAALKTIACGICPKSQQVYFLQKHFLTISKGCGTLQLSDFLW